MGKVNGKRPEGIEHDMISSWNLPNAFPVHRRYNPSTHIAALYLQTSYDEIHPSALSPYRGVSVLSIDDVLHVSEASSNPSYPEAIGLG